MNRRILAALLLIVSTLPVLAQKRRAVAPPSGPAVDVRHLNAARAAAAWLATMERNGGWVISEGSTGVSTGIDTGAAGIGAFHLKLYRITGERAYLDKAIAAGQFIAGVYANGGGGVDWLNGRAGGGDYFLALYDTTGDGRWLDEAKKAAAQLTARALKEGDGTYWNNGQIFTSLAHGAGGIGLFFVHLHEVTREQQYLDMAMSAYRFMKRHTLPAGSGITFKRLTGDAAGYNGWCGGSVGAAIFFEELHRSTGDPEVKQTWIATLEGLVDAAVPVRDTLAWRYGPSSGGSAYPIIHCHGGAGMSAVLARGFTALGDLRYREAAVRGARWLDGVAVTQTSGLSWHHIAGSPLHELGLLTGTASVGHASLELYRAFRDPNDLARAEAAAEWLLSMAEKPAEGQMKWITRTDTAGGTPRYDTGWYMGAAGIGLFLLELHELERGTVLPQRFSVFNP